MDDISEESLSSRMRPQPRRMNFQVDVCVRGAAHGCRKCPIKFENKFSCLLTGGLQMLQHAVAALERRGSKVLVRARVDSIILSPDGQRALGVRVNGGADVLAKRGVVCAAGAYTAFQKLLPASPDVPELAKVQSCPRALPMAKVLILWMPCVLWFGGLE